MPLWGGKRNIYVFFGATHDNSLGICKYESPTWILNIPHVRTLRSSQGGEEKLQERHESNEEKLKKRKERSKKLK